MVGICVTETFNICSFRTVHFDGLILFHLQTRPAVRQITDALAISKNQISVSMLFWRLQVRLAGKFAALTQFEL